MQVKFNTYTLTCLHPYQENLMEDLIARLKEIEAKIQRLMERL